MIGDTISAVQRRDSAPAVGDFGGPCLVGQCSLDATVLDPENTVFGLPKEGSYLYGTWRDEDGNLLRALRLVHPHSSDFAFVFTSSPGTHLARDESVESDMWSGPISTTIDGSSAVFESSTQSSTESSTSSLFRFEHRTDACSWIDGDVLVVENTLVGPAMQWFNTWDGGACYSTTSKYLSSGTLLGRRVEGFVGHEIHYFPAGVSWMSSPYAAGREICWQQVANEYDDGTTVQAMFAYGFDGWGFAMVEDEFGVFHSSTELTAEATVLDNGYPASVTYRFADQTWTWRIADQGQRAPLVPDSPLRGADGTCRRDGDERTVVRSLGNSNWWADGRATPIIRS